MVETVNVPPPLPKSPKPSTPQSVISDAARKDHVSRKRAGLSIKDSNCVPEKRRVTTKTTSWKLLPVRKAKPLYTARPVNILDQQLPSQDEDENPDHQLSLIDRIAKIWPPTS